MATTKTLTPTNQAITLAAFTEKPDNRTNVTNDDKLADAVNALNSNMSTLTYTGTVDSLQTSLVSLASNMSVGEFRNIKYTAGETLAPFRNSRIYGGTFKRTGSNYWSVTLEDPEGVPVYGTYRNGTWSWEPLALSSKFFIGNLTFDGTGFPTTKATTNGLTTTGRSTNGAVYLLWYRSASNDFRVVETLHGSGAPSSGDVVTVFYPIG